MAVSLCLPISFLVGGGLMATLIGWIGDTSSIGFGFVIAGIMMVIGGGALLFVTFLNNEKMIP